MSFYKIHSESVHWCGCWNDSYVKAENSEELDELIEANEDYVRTELIDTPEEDNEEWFEDYDAVTSDVAVVTEEEYLRFRN